MTISTLSHCVYSDLATTTVTSYAPRIVTFLRQKSGVHSRGKSRLNYVSRGSNALLFHYPALGCSIRYTVCGMAIRLLGRGGSTLPILCYAKTPHAVLTIALLTQHIPRHLPMCSKARTQIRFMGSLQLCTTTFETSCFIELLTPRCLLPDEWRQE